MISKKKIHELTLQAESPKEGISLIGPITVIKHISNRNMLAIGFEDGRIAIVE